MSSHVQRSMCGQVLHVLYEGTIREMAIFQLESDSHYHDTLLRAMQPHLQAADEILISQGTRAQEMFLITSGVLSVSCTSTTNDACVGSESSMGTRRGAMHTIDLGKVYPGDHVGEIGLLDQTAFAACPRAQRPEPGMRTATVISNTFCELFRIGYHDFRELCRAYPNIKEALANTARHKLSRSSPTVPGIARHGSCKSAISR